MKEKQILKLLQAKNKNLRLPSGMGFSIEDNVLTITMKEKGLISNMQTDDSAFEGWAICLKAWLPEFIDQVYIEGKAPTNISDKHYQRFLYRLDKFIKIYTWASTKSFEIELAEFRRKNVNVVINVPKSNASESATHCEAQLERVFYKRNKISCSYDFIDHQLPVRLFNDEIKEEKSITPKSYLDIWAIKGNLLRIFELKLPTNTGIGIISELMFYVNVMIDVIKGDVKIPFSSEYRSFNHLFEFQKNKKCKKIEGVLLANNLHSGIKNKLDEVLHIINGGDFSFNTEYLYENPEHVNVSITKDNLEECIDMKKEKSYKQLQKEKQLTLLQHSDFFEYAIGCGICWNKEKKEWRQYPHILQHQDSLKNLFAPIRSAVINYFDVYDIAWWRQHEDRYFPTGNLLSSQIHCLNHLFALRKDKDAVLAIVNHATGMVFDEVLPSSLDKDGGYIAFEFAYKNDELLGENDNGARRGYMWTSKDAMIVARKGKDKWLIPIEWKYTETYEKEDKTCRKRLERYEKRIKESDQLKMPENGRIPNSIYFQEPSYELMRQTLLCEQLQHKGLAKNFFHLNVIPKGNTALREAVEKEYIPMLKDPSKFKIIDPQDLLSPLKGNDDYKELMEYLETRYWK